MKKNEKSFRRLTAVLKSLTAVIFIGLSTQIVSGQNLLTNDDFSSGLTGWKTEGSVTADAGAATLSEGTEAPVLYQPVAVSGYVYELRFDVDLGGLSVSSGSGQSDRAWLLLYLGTEAGSLTPDGAADEAVLIEADSSGLLSVAENAQVVANAALGAGWYSAVVEVISDFEAIAPACRLIDGNGTADSSMSIDNVVLKALDRGRFANISNRGGVGTGASIMIPGFVIEGPTNKSLVIRGVGPTLGELDVPGTISDPQLKLYYKPPSQPGQPLPADELKQENDNWEAAPDVEALKAAMKSVGAFDLTAGSADAALLAENLVPGAYTVQVSGVDGATGVALAEVYDLGASADGPTELVNISNRGYIGTGSSVQIPGFVIQGTRGRVVLVRAVGPTLGGFEVPDTIEDPTLNLFDQADQSTPMFTNDNWEDAANTTEVETTAARVGAFALNAGSKDAAILASLPPGRYTAVAKGVDGATGVALVEVYVVTDNQRPTAYNNSFYVATAAANVLPMDEILGNDTDPENDVLSVSFYTQPDEGTVTMNDDGELVYTSPAEFWGETIFSYRASDGEYESVPATVALQVTPADTAIWIGGSSDNFSDPANWVGGEAPKETDAVWIAPEGGGTVLVDADANVGSIRVGGTGTDVTLKLNGRTLTTSGGIEILPGSTFEMSNGTLDTGEDTVIRGTLEWAGGVMTGDATTIIADGASAVLNASPVYLRGGRDFINHGTLSQSGSAELRADTPDATTDITNAAGAQWTVSLGNHGRMIYPNHSTATLNFVNAGTLTKTSAGLTYLGHTNGTFNLTSTGTVEAESGTLEISTSATNVFSGPVDLAAGTALSLPGGSIILEGETPLPGEGVLQVRGGTVTLSDDATLPLVELSGGTLVIAKSLSVGNLTHSNGTLSGPGDVTVTGTLDWDNGVMTGDATTTIADGATALLNANAVYLRGGRDFINHGTLSQSGGAELRTDTPDATTDITNAAGGQWTVSLGNHGRMIYPNHSTATLNFVNAGTLTKTSAGLTYLGHTNGTFNLTSTGTVEAESGTLEISTSATNVFSGPVDLAAGTALSLPGGSIILEGETPLPGEGVLQVRGGTVTLSDDATLPLVELSGGTLVIAKSLSVGNLTHSNGTLSGPGDVTVTGTLDWDNGVMTGDATTTIADGATALLNANAVYLRGGRDFINHGTLSQSGGAELRTDTPDATTDITNAAGGQWTVSLGNHGRMIYPNHSTATLNFLNAGTLTKTSSGLTYLGHTNGTFNLTSTGTVEAESGTLEISTNATNVFSGPVELAAGTALSLPGGSIILEGETPLPGEGVLQVRGGTVTLSDDATLPLVELSGGTLVIAKSLSVGNLTHSNGTLSGPGDVTVTGTLDWDNGVMTGDATTTIADGATALLNANAVYLRGGRDFINHGTLSQSGGAELRADTPDATTDITNAAGGQWTVSLGNHGRMIYPNHSTATLNFLNAGTLTKTSADLNYLGYTNGTFNLTSTGTVEVESGTLEISTSATNVFSGPVDLAAGTALSLPGGSIILEGETPLPGEGVLQVRGGTVTLSDDATLPLVELSGGTLVIAKSLSVGNLTHSNGTLSGPGDVTVTGTLDWDNGVMTGDATTTIADGATALLNANAVYLRGGRDFINHGTLSQSGGAELRTDTPDATTDITNAAGAQWTVSLGNHGRMIYPNHSTATLNFLNAGTLTKTSADLNYLGYTNGTFNLTSTGTVEVELGTLQIEGTSTVLDPSGTVRLTTNGSTKPLVRQGALTIGGTLEVVLADGYAPANGTTIRLIDYGSRSGNFSTITPPQGRTISETYQGDGLDVTID